MFALPMGMGDGRKGLAPCSKVSRSSLSVGLFLLLPLFSCSKNDAMTGDAQMVPTNFKIRNGEAAVGEKFDSVVAIGNSRSGVFCTGTLIRPRVTLTAAHCAQAIVEEGGISYVGSEGKSASVLNLFIHPGYEPEIGVGTIDLALLGVDRDFAKTSTIYRGGEVKQNDEIRAVGFGFDGRGSDGDGNFGTKREGALYFKRYLSAETAWGLFPRSLLLFLHRRPAEQATCAGDSGSPAFLQGQILGVLSGGYYAYGIPICALSASSIYVSATRFRNWIMETASRLEKNLFESRR